MSAQLTRGGIGSHTRPNRGLSDNWITPPEIVEALGHFDLDPCVCDQQPWDTADIGIRRRQDGLAQDWSGYRVWLNPPYGEKTILWLAKLILLDRPGKSGLISRPAALTFLKTLSERGRREASDQRPADNRMEAAPRLVQPGSRLPAYHRQEPGTRDYSRAGSRADLLAHFSRTGGSIPPTGVCCRSYPATSVSACASPVAAIGSSLFPEGPQTSCRRRFDEGCKSAPRAVSPTGAGGMEGIIAFVVRSEIDSQ